MRDHALSPLDIKVWGPSAWRWLHVVAWTYPLAPTHADRMHMLEFLRTFARSIPCAKCRTHFSRMMHRDLASGANSSILESRRSLTAATVGWHNRVNRRLKKKELDYATVELMYTAPQSRPGRGPLLWLMLAVSLSVLFWYRRTRAGIQTLRHAPVQGAGRRRFS
jgi:hypothetical protein